MRKTRPSDIMSILLEGLDTAFDTRSWHGANLVGAIRGVHAKEAAARRGNGRKTIWEQLLHAAYWKHRVISHLIKRTKFESTPFPRKGSNWPRTPAAANEAAWRADIAMLRDLHRELRDIVASFPSAKLARDKKIRWFIQGAAAHDLYHAGQIKLLRRLR